MTKVMFKVVALVLQRVKGFILNLPSGPCGPHQRNQVGGVDLYIRHPGKVLHLPVGMDFPVFQEVHFQLKVLMIQWRPIEITETMDDLPVIGHFMGTRGLRGFYPFEQEFVVRCLGTQ